MKKEYTFKIMKGTEGLIYYQELKKHFKTSKLLNNTDINYLTNNFHLLNDFSNRKYNHLDINAVIENNNIMEFQHISPLYFHCYQRKSISDKQAEFFAKYLTVKQLQFIPKILLRKMSLNLLKDIYENIKNYQLDYYTVYVSNKNDIKECLFLSTKTVSEMLSSIIMDKELFCKSDESMDSNEIFDLTLTRFQEKGITQDEISTFLDIRKETFIKSDLNKILKYKKHNGDRKKYYDINQFVEVLQNKYINGESKIEYDLKKCSGLYKAEKLIEMYGVTFTIHRVNKLIRDGKVGYYQLSEKIFRMSTNDFEHMIENHITSHSLVKLQRNIKLNENEKLDEKYILADNILKIIYQDEFSELLAYNSNLYKKEILKKYERFTDDNKKYYFKKSDMNEYVSSCYEKKDINGNNIKVKNNFTLDNIGIIYNRTNAPEKLAKKYNYNASMNTLRLYINNAYSNGELPLFKFSQRNMVIREEDLLNIKSISNLLKRNGNLI